MQTKQIRQMNVRRKKRALINEKPKRIFFIYICLLTLIGSDTERKLNVFIRFTIKV